MPFRYQMEPQDEEEYCPACLKRNCRGTCPQFYQGIRRFDEPEPPKEKAKPLRLTGWKPRAAKGETWTKE